MATLRIVNVDQRTKAKLRLPAARDGRSLEEEARTILRATIEICQPSAVVLGLGRCIHRQSAQLVAWRWSGLSAAHCQPELSLKATLS